MIIKNSVDVFIRFHHTISFLLAMTINSRRRQPNAKSLIESSNESEIDEAGRNVLGEVADLFSLSLCLPAQTWKAPNCKSRFYGIPRLVFNEKLCETTILKLINDRENMQLKYRAPKLFCRMNNEWWDFLYVLIIVDGAGRCSRGNVVSRGSKSTSRADKANCFAKPHCKEGRIFYANSPTGVLLLLLLKRYFQLDIRTL